MKDTVNTTYRILGYLSVGLTGAGGALISTSGWFVFLCVLGGMLNGHIVSELVWYRNEFRKFVKPKRERVR